MRPHHATEVIVDVLRGELASVLEHLFVQPDHLAVLVIGDGFPRSEAETR
jgi:hypothetical protein